MSYNTPLVDKLYVIARSQIVYAAWAKSIVYAIRGEKTYQNAEMSNIPSWKNI